MYLAVIILPLLGSIASGFFGRKVGVSGAQLITTACVSITTMFAILMFTEITFNDASVYISVCRWLELASINLLWGFNFDFLTVSMLIPVLVISCLVHIYSIGYMSGDPHNQRFFSYLSLFTFMMIILVTSNNFLLMFVGWEGVGICSYLLVNFWFTRIAANQSSISALLTNRVGDCFLTIGMFIMLLSYGNIDYTTVFSLAPFIGEKMITFASVCLLIGAMAKSSQIGLHVWLPLAMEGPTPVSALIHAATMVTAGVYLLIRTSPLLEYSSTALLACLWIGSVTTVFSSVVGLFQQDIKKVIAYSTMSQLGMMVIAIGLSCYNLALFHLVNHAFYKGLLFLAAGAVIHAVADNQDFRKYGGLILFLPLTYTVMLIASLSLVAFPFMTGFYSKDFILESCFSQFTYSSIAVYFTAVIGAIFTTLYSVKVLYLTFMASPNAPSITYNKAHESDIYMSLPLIILAIFSVYFGFFTKDIFIGIGSHAYVDNSIFIHPLHEVFISSEFAVPHFFKLLPFFLTITALIVSIIVFETMPRLIIIIKYTRIVYHIFSYFNLKFLVESIYNRFITYFILKVGGQTTKVLDKGFVEMIGPYGLEIFLKSLSNNLNMLNTNVVTTYALYILTAFIFYVCLPYYYKDSFVLFILMCVAVSFAYYLLKQYNSNKNDIIYKSDPIMVVKSGFLDLDTLTNVLIFASATFIGVGLVAASRAVYSSLNNHKDIKGQCDDNSILQKANTVDGDNTIIAEADKLDHYLDTVFYSEYSPVKWIADLGSCREFYVIGGLVIVCIGLWRSYAVFKFNDDINKIAEHSSTNRLQTEHTPDGRSSDVIKDIVDNTYDSQNRFVQGFQRWTEMRVNRVPIEGGLDYDFRIDCQIDDQYVRDFWLWPLPIKVHSHVMSFVELTGSGPDNVRKFSQTIYQIWNPFSGILPDIQWNFGNYVPQWNLPPVPGYFRFYRVAEDWIDIFDQGLVGNMDLSFYLATTLWA